MNRFAILYTSPTILEMQMQGRQAKDVHRHSCTRLAMAYSGTSGTQAYSAGCEGQA